MTRSAGFPRLSLKNAVYIMEKAMSFGRKWNKEEFATFGAKSNAKGSVNSGAFLYRLSALKEFGLITTSKQEVESTELSSKILKPISVSEKNEALIAAFKSSKIYNEIINSVQHNISLEKTFLAEIAVRKFGISRDQMQRFVGGFLESGKYAGLIQQPDNEHFVVISIRDDMGSQINNTEDKGDAGSSIDGNNFMVENSQSSGTHIELKMRSGVYFNLKAERGVTRKEVDAISTILNSLVVEEDRDEVI